MDKYYNQIKDKLIDVEIQNRVKDYSKNKYTLEKYYEVGKLLFEAQGGEKRAKYGDGLIKDYSKRLSKELGKAYSVKTLMRIRQFYLFFPNVATLWRHLSWSHFKVLLPLVDKNEINYYISKCVSYNLSVRNLSQLIKSKEYERLPESTKNKLITSENIQIDDIVPNPIIIKNNSNMNLVKEKALQQLILDDIPSFLEQLGDGFTFIKNEYPIKIGDIYNYIDLLLFNYIYNCFVVVELKVNDLKKDNIGQILTYVSYVDKYIKKEFHNDTVGIIVSKRNNRFIIELCTNPNITFREYKII